MKQYVSIKQLSTTIGLSPRTLRRWVIDPVNPLPCYHVGGKLLFEESEVEQWLEKFRVDTIDMDAIVDGLKTYFTKKDAEGKDVQNTITGEL